MRRSAQDQQRLQTREAQDRQWHGPLPDIGAMPPRSIDSNRVRLEWDTRDTMSGRMWEHTMVTGPTQVTAAMLASHPTGGATPFMPGAARQDQRVWSPSDGMAGYFPTGPDPMSRPQLPPKSLFQNAWADGYDMGGGGAAREVRSAVKEDNRYRGEDVSARLAGRTFEHQWIPPTVTKQIVNAQIDAAARLRPVADDWMRPPQ
jgi:hypothetical protein